METNQIEIGEIRLQVLVANAYDATWYQQRKTYEEVQSLLYPLIRVHGFHTFIDVGANYGLVSILARRAAPELRVIAIEADPRLSALIEGNFVLNELPPPEVLNTVVGAESRAEAEFSLNPRSSLDNRVTMQGWKRCSLPMRTLDSICAELAVTGPTFIKIDTQGYEQYVLRGLRQTLERSDDWLIKMEFAPDWLRSQGTNPLELLNQLVAQYRVAEYPERLRFNTNSLESLFDKRLSVDQCGSFLQHVTALNQRGLGWVDLIVGPRGG
jgi:FkbM family methyltransferase